MSIVKFVNTCRAVVLFKETINSNGNDIDVLYINNGKVSYPIPPSEISEIEKLIKSTKNYYNKTKIKEEDIEVFYNKCISELIIEYSNKTEVTKKERKLTPGCVYFILNKSNGFVKIGKSININSRLKSLTGYYGKDLKLLFKIDTECCNSLEKELHKEYVDFRKYGEWFELSNEVINSIKIKYNESSI